MGTKKLVPGAHKGTYNSASLTKKNSQQNLTSAISDGQKASMPKKTIPTKPQFRKKLAEKRHENSALSSHNGNSRDNQNNSAVSHMQPSQDDDEYLNI
jgi:hypothetical protein